MDMQLFFYIVVLNAELEFFYNILNDKDKCRFRHIRNIHRETHEEIYLKCKLILKEVLRDTNPLYCYFFQYICNTFVQRVS